MATKIHLNDGLAFIVNEPFDAVERIYREALATKTTLRIKNGTKKIHSVNPASIAFIENLTEAEVEAEATLRPEREAKAAI